MFENIAKFFKKLVKAENHDSSKEMAKERLHLVLMQDRANVSADFLEMMKQEIIEVIKKYIDVDENAIDVRLTNKSNEDGTNGAPALYANIPIISIKEDAKKADRNQGKPKGEVKQEEVKQEEVKLESEPESQEVADITSENQEEVKNEAKEQEQQVLPEEQIEKVKSEDEDKISEEEKKETADH